MASQAVCDLLDRLDHELSEDIGFALLPETVMVLAEAFRADKPNYARLAGVLRKYKTLRATEAAVKQKARELSHLQPVTGGNEPIEIHLTPVVEIHEGAPVPRTVVVPPGWRLIEPRGTSEFALIRIIAKGDAPEVIPVSRMPILVTRQFVDVRDDTAALEVAWRPGAKWEKRVVDRERLIGTREILDALGPYGFPVTCNNAREIVQFIADMEATNRHALPRSYCSPQLGWQGRCGERGFLAGKTHCANGDESTIEFVGGDDGDRHAAWSVRATGEWSAWADAVAAVTSYPRVMLALYASLAAPLLAILRAPGFTVDWSYKTSSGKTTALSLAASVWGGPDPLAQDSFIATWDMTQVGFERRASTFCDLPFIVDDTKRARSYGKQSAVPGILYEIAGGQGRVRGTVKGTERSMRWRTIMLTSGEQRAIDFDKSGGTVARVLTLWGNPFGTSTPAIGNAIDRMLSIIYDNYGHAGPLFAKWLVDHHDSEDKWRERHHELAGGHKARLADAATETVDHAALGRLAKNLAVIELAGELAHEALPLPWKYDSPVDKSASSAVMGIESIDREIEALRYVYDLANANRRKFLGGAAPEAAEPHGGWLGYWENVPEWEAIAIYRERIDSMLVKGQFEPGGILRRWAELGWLKKTEGDRLVCRVDDCEGRPRMIVILRHALATVGCVDALEAPPKQLEAQFQ